MRLVIAEDQGMLRGALAQLLEMEDDIEVIGQTGNGRDAVELIKKQTPDLLIADIEMPGMTGLEVAEEIKRSCSSCKVVIVTTFARPGYLERAMKAGASGYILKDEPINNLIAHLRLINNGGRFISPELATAFYFAKENPLTEREQDVLRQAYSGCGTQQIADHFHLTRGTVRNYLSTAIQKMDAHSRQEAAKKAKDNGWI
ncbi:response regulator transcription factor [Sporolactobacillus nakayamae]|uniref:Two component transcriptional regulator, LuxR family n=1 Tax=Sporolactobacillus nakayamae TaxID=269670 RepID=A0A1I2RAP6_9BACL|nr:response regulator transcription factor [Sporolactobacillus nakayamae]SFG37795.1 two component transcriptional regulator, LuxR family [Sporolactobacillus nakayamae]